MRLFVFNTDATFERADICRRAKISQETARRELASLQRAGLIKRRQFYKATTRGKGRQAETVKKAVHGWGADQTFPYFQEVRQFLLDTLSLSNRDLAQRFQHTGTIKLLIAAGVFVGDWEQRIDLLIAGDKINERKVQTAIHTLEAEVGRELRYAVFSIDDFKYRLRVYDRLVRDVLDYEHRVILDKFGYFS